MSELNAFYEAFAYRLATPEAPDHVSVEIGFVGYLRLKEAFALASSDAGHAAITAEAASRFIGEHLSVLAEPLAAALRNSGVRHLELAGEALLRRVGPGPKLENELRACLPGRGEPLHSLRQRLPEAGATQAHFRFARLRWREIGRANRRLF